MIYTIEFELPDNDTVIKNIKTARVSWSVWGYSGVTHAQPKNENEPIKQAQIAPNEDLISRKAAVDYCYQLINVEHQQGSDEMNYGHERVNQTETILHHLEIMPSAQPEIIRCKECVYADDFYHCDYMSTWNDGECFCSYGKRRTDGV